ncbi:hypothetical protein BDF22DRAFT_606655, partial [Syncephalis plumigaleata]
AIYEAKKMYVAYTNNVRLRFGEFLRRAINKVFDVKKKLKTMRGRLSKKANADELHKKTSAITAPAREFKLAIAQRGVRRTAFKKDPMSAKAFNRFKNVLSAYPDGYTFEKNIYYDCVARPVKHFKAFFELARLFPRIGLKPFNCFPLRRSFSPCYIHIDT